MTSEDIKQVFRHRIRFVRHTQDRTVTEVAASVGVHDTRVSHMETYLRAPRLPSVFMMSKALNAAPSYLSGEGELWPIPPSTVPAFDREWVQEFITTRLLELLRETGLTQSELARRTGCTKQLIALVATGGKVPVLQTTMRFAAALDVSLSRMLDPLEVAAWAA